MVLASVPLTERQHELLRLVGAGLTKTEAAARLHMSPHTVREHLQNAYRRLHVTTGTAEIAKAFPDQF